MTEHIPLFSGKLSFFVMATLNEIISGSISSGGGGVGGQGGSFPPNFSAFPQTLELPPQVACYGDLGEK